MKTIITGEDRSFLDLKEMRRYAGLFRYLSLRDVFVRYKQTWVGFGWSVIRPAINIAIFGTISWLIDRNADPVERFLSVSVCIVFWQLISTCVAEVSSSLSNNANILTKVYFPKLLLPLSGILVCIVDFLIAFTVLMILFLVFHGAPGWQILLLPLVIVYGLLFCFGFGLIFATASVKYRDVKFILPFIMQVLFYASPVVISSDFVLQKGIAEWMKVLYQLNPLVHIINSFKFCFYGHFDDFDPVYFSISLVILIVMLIVSLRYFFHFEKSFADHI